MEINCKTFEELSKDELYDLLQLRSEVFVVEQQCIYQDIDGKDKKALHVMGFKNNKMIAYTRIFKAGDYFDKASIGRVLVKKGERKYGYGHIILKASIKNIQKEFSETEIKISAQTYLEKFYESHGFKKQGEMYLEDDIPHITMIL